MKTKYQQNLLAAGIFAALAFIATVSRAADPLPSWNNGKAKQAIIEFVAKVTKEGAPDFVPVTERIAVFDNDGTLWAEQPLYVQLRFALDRVKALAPQHPEWQKQEPFKKLLSTPKEENVAVSEHELLEIVMATHAGMTTEEFEQIVRDWIATAKHPKTGRPYTAMVYQPMVELLAYLRANGFKTFIVSGGGIEFMRPWTEKVYGIPPEQVIGSSGKTKMELRAGRPVLVKLPEVSFIDDKDGKPVGINQHIGRRPIAAFGNSDGDLEMLQWTAAGSGPRFCLYVHHTDAAREWAYDRKSGIGQLDKGLDEAQAKGWTVVSMKDDWNQVFPFEITAIGIVLNPDATILEHAAANNARLLGVYPKGFALDETHPPHLTMLQCFVRTADLDKVYAAEEKVIAAANMTGMKLEAFKFYYLPAGSGMGIAGVCAKPTPQLLKLQAGIIAAASPFNLRAGPIGAFTAPHDNPVFDAGIIQYVSTFEQIGAGEQFNPHVTTGIAPTEDLDKMNAEPFAPFTFSPAGAAIYQLGPFGTAAKKLKDWDLKR